MRHTGHPHLDGGVNRCTEHKLAARGGAQACHSANMSGERPYVIVTLNIHDLNILIKCSCKPQHTRLTKTITSIL